jgi:hypothetical protein
VTGYLPTLQPLRELGWVSLVEEKFGVALASGQLRQAIEQAASVTKVKTIQELESWEGLDVADERLDYDSIMDILQRLEVAFDLMFYEAGRLSENLGAGMSRDRPRSRPWIVKHLTPLLEKVREVCMYNRWAYELSETDNMSDIIDHTMFMIPPRAVSKSLSWSEIISYIHELLSGVSYAYNKFYEHIGELRETIEGAKAINQSKKGAALHVLIRYATGPLDDVTGIFNELWRRLGYEMLITGAEQETQDA